MSNNLDIRHFKTEYTVFFQDTDLPTLAGDLPFQGNPPSKSDILLALADRYPDLDWNTTQRVTYSSYEVMHNNARIVSSEGEVTPEEVTALLQPKEEQSQ